jgi:hypothetical protein
MKTEKLFFTNIAARNSFGLGNSCCISFGLGLIVDGEGIPEEIRDMKTLCTSNYYEEDPLEQSNRFSQHLMEIMGSYRR